KRALLAEDLTLKGGLLDVARRRGDARSFRSRPSPSAPPSITGPSTRRQYFHQEGSARSSTQGGSIPGSPRSAAVNRSAACRRLATTSSSFGNWAAATAPCSSLRR